MHVQYDPLTHDGVTDEERSKQDPVVKGLMGAMGAFFGLQVGLLIIICAPILLPLYGIAWLIRDRKASPSSAPSPSGEPSAGRPSSDRPNGS